MTKSNGTTFKKGRKKTGGRKAGTPNKRTMLLGEAVLAAAEAAGNELGGDGHVSYMKFVALNQPKTFFPVLVSSMPQQLEPEPSDGDTVLHTMDDVRAHLRSLGIAPEALGRALLDSPSRSHDEEYSTTAGQTSSTGDRDVEDDASNASTGRGEV
jgi:hypothetical protein